MCTKAFTSSVFCFLNNVDDKSRNTGIETVFLKLSVHLGKCSEWWTGLSLLPLFTHKWERLLKSICSFKMQNYINEVKCSRKFINSQCRHIKASHHLSSLLWGTIRSTAAILPHFTPMSQSLHAGQSGGPLCTAGSHGMSDTGMCLYTGYSAPECDD